MNLLFLHKNCSAHNQTKARTTSCVAGKKWDWPINTWLDSLMKPFPHVDDQLGKPCTSDIWLESPSQLLHFPVCPEDRSVSIDCFHSGLDGCGSKKPWSPEELFLTFTKEKYHCLFVAAEMWESFCYWVERGTIKELVQEQATAGVARCLHRRKE